MSRLAGIIPVDTPRGPAFLRTETFFGRNDRQRDQLARLQEMDVGSLAPLLAVEPDERESFAGTIFFDLETTGVSGGAGTGIVVLGMARPVAGGLETWQLLVAAPHLEPAALSAAADWTDRVADGPLVSFNGGSFDLPVLTSRSVLGRQPLDMLRRRHVDLLHPARRLWRFDLASHRLQDIEREILGIVRDDDLPGSDVPALYFDVLRTEQWERLDLVLRHNADDLIGLALATVAIADAAQGDCRSAGEWLGLARCIEARSSSREALHAYERAAEAAQWNGPVGAEARWRLANCSRRLGEIERAVRLWRDLAAAANYRQRDALLALAKHAEWRERDAKSALAHTDALLEGRADVDRAALLKRRERLRSKLRRGSGAQVAEDRSEAVWRGAGEPWAWRTRGKVAR